MSSRGKRYKTQFFFKKTAQNNTFFFEERYEYLCRASLTRQSRITYIEQIVHMQEKASIEKTVRKYNLNALPKLPVISLNFLIRRLNCICHLLQINFNDKLILTIVLSCVKPFYILFFLDLDHFEYVFLPFITLYARILT